MHGVCARFFNTINTELHGVPESGAVLQTQKLGTSYSETTHLLGLKLRQQRGRMSTLGCQFDTQQMHIITFCCKTTFAACSALIIFAAIMVPISLRETTETV